ncbi:MAG: Mobile element protein, partial [uncultured Caballeronia sp.]
KANGIDPYRYLTWLFRLLPLAKTVDDYDTLLSWKMPADLSSANPLLPLPRSARPRNMF